MQAFKSTHTLSHCSEFQDVHVFVEWLLEIEELIGESDQRLHSQMLLLLP